MTLLYDHLLARLEPLCERSLLRPAPLEPAGSSPGARGTPRRFAAALEKTIVRHVEVLVLDPAVRRAVLDHPELAIGWSLDDVEEGTGGALLQALGALIKEELAANGDRPNRPPWPSNITINELTDALEGTRDDAAIRVANACRSGELQLVGSTPDELRFQLGAEPAVDGEASLAEAPYEPLLREAMTRWNVHRTALIVSVEKRARVLSSPLEAMRFARGLLDEIASSTSHGTVLRRRVVDAALRATNEGDFVSDSRVSEELERELAVHLGRLRGDLLDAQPPTDTAAVRLVDGVLAWDAHLAGELEKLGEAGRVNAVDLRKKARSRVEGGVNAAAWKLWAHMEHSPAGCRFAELLARVLWKDVVFARVRKAPALAMAVHEPVNYLFSKARQEGEIDGQRTLTIPGGTLVRVAAVDADSLRAVFVDRGIKLFGSVTAHRLIRWEIRQGHRQALGGEADPRVLRVPGGYSMLANGGGDEGLGMNSKQAADEVRAIIEAQHAVEVPIPPHGDYSRLLIRRFTPAVGRRKAYLELVLGTALLPDYVQELRRAMGNSLEARRALRLVPILDLPPFIGGRQNDHGPQATLSMLVVAFMRDRAAELVTQGGVTITLEDFTRLAKVACVSSPVVTIIDRWIQDGPDAPAFLCRQGPDRYTLGKAHSIAQELMVDGGRRELEGREAGKASATVRRAKLQRRSGRTNSSPHQS